MPITLPTDPADLRLETLNALIGQDTPGARLDGFEVTESHVWGSGLASSAGRMLIAPRWSAGAPADLPASLVLKVARSLPDAPDTPNPIAGAGGALYDNEVAVYRALRPWTFLESPRFLGGAHDPASNALLLVMEDLRLRGASFPSVLTPTSLTRVRSLLAQLARLHARWWNSPELHTTLGWMEAHTSGRLHTQFSTREMAPMHIAHQVETVAFKREMVERLGTDAWGLFDQFRRVQQHQATLAQTVCHGDTHIGNTYALPDDSGGLLDWQLASRGHAIHDVAYILATALSVAERRVQERDLLAEYREMLRAAGVSEPPSLEALWLEYRRAMVWGVYIGWLTTPVVNYGWEISVMAHLRVMTAYEDLETARAIALLD